MTKAEKIGQSIRTRMTTLGYYHKDMAAMLCMTRWMWRDRMQNPEHFRVDELESVEEILHIKLI